MNTTTNNTLSMALMSKEQEVKTQQDTKEWLRYSQGIAAIMSKRMAELGLTQRMLAEKMDCTQQYISNVLKGEKNMSLETICKIESALGVEIIKGLNQWVTSKKKICLYRVKQHWKPA